MLSVVLNLSTVTNCQQNFYSRKWSSMRRKNYIWHSENDDFIKFANARILLLLKYKMFPGAKSISTISEEGGFNFTKTKKYKQVTLKNPKWIRGMQNCQEYLEAYQTSIMEVFS